MITVHLNFLVINFFDKKKQRSMSWHTCVTESTRKTINKYTLIYDTHVVLIVQMSFCSFSPVAFWARADFIEARPVHVQRTKSLKCK